MICTCIPYLEVHLLENMFHCFHVSPFSIIVHENCDAFILNNVLSHTATQRINTPAISDNWTHYHFLVTLSHFSQPACTPPITFLSCAPVSSCSDSASCECWRRMALRIAIIIPYVLKVCLHINTKGHYK
jgi:hypothetical protein